MRDIATVDLQAGPASNLAAGLSASMHKARSSESMDSMHRVNSLRMRRLNTLRCSPVEASSVVDQGFALWLVLESDGQILRGGIVEPVEPEEEPIDDEEEPVENQEEPVEDAETDGCLSPTPVVSALKRMTKSLRSPVHLSSLIQTPKRGLAPRACALMTWLMRLVARAVLGVT